MGEKENRAIQIVQRKGDVVVWGPPSSNEATDARLPRIICYGDSNTVGYCSGGRQFQAYGETLASELFAAGVPCEVAICGLCGYTTQDMLKEQSSECVMPPVGPKGRGLKRMLEEDGPADLVLIMTGTNDLGFHTGIPTIVHHVAQLHSICYQRGVPTVAIAATQCSPTHFRSLRQHLADSIAKWAGATPGVLDFLDVEDLVPRPVGKDGTSSNPSAAAHWETDDLHLSAVGSKMLGRRLAAYAVSWTRKLENEVPKASSSAATVRDRDDRENTRSPKPRLRDVLQAATQPKVSAARVSFAMRTGHRQSSHAMTFSASHVQWCH